MRITPRAWIGLAIYVGYVLVIYAVSKLSGVAYTDIGTSAEFTWRGAVLDLAVGAVLLAITTWLLGWWKPALFERKRSHHKWPIFVPALMLLVAVLNLFNTDWSKFDASFLLSLLALGIAVGFCEELMSRGLLLTAFRSRLPEVWVWLLTSVLFGAMHLINAALGLPSRTPLDKWCWPRCRVQASTSCGGSRAPSFGRWRCTASGISLRFRSALPRSALPGRPT